MNEARADETPTAFGIRMVEENGRRLALTELRQRVRNRLNAVSGPVDDRKMTCGLEYVLQMITDDLFLLED